MKVMPLLLSLMFFISPWAHAQVFHNLPESPPKKIFHLLAGQQFGTIRDVSVGETEDGKLTVNLTVDIGGCWGRESKAREVAKETMERIYQSGLPISEVVAKIISQDTTLIILALGKNQAEKIHWDSIKTGADFIAHLKSNYTNTVSGQQVEDRFILIEHSRTSRPSPFRRVGD